MADKAKGILLSDGKSLYFMDIETKNQVDTNTKNIETKAEQEDLDTLSRNIEEVSIDLQTVLRQMQLGVTQIEERLSNLEYMIIENDFTVPISINSEGTEILVDDSGYALVVDWKI